MFKGRLASSCHLANVFFVVSFSLFSLGHGDFRFCLNGPHLMKDADCPGGFIFKEGTKSNCKYYSKTGNQEGIVLSAPVDVCDETTLRAIENRGDDLGDIETLTYLIWEEMDSANESTPEAQAYPGNVTDMCQTECLEEWEDTSTVPDEEPIPEDWDPALVTEIDKKYCKRLNRKIFLRVLLDDEDIPDVQKTPKRKVGQPLQILERTNEINPLQFEDDEDEEFSQEYPTPGPPSIPVTGPTTTTPLPPPPESVSESPTSYASTFYNSLIATSPYDSSQLNVIKLLARSMRIMGSACSPYIREEFFEQVLKGMMLISKMNEDNILDVGHDAYHGITSLLESCAQKRFQEYVLNGTQCEGDERIEGIYNTHSEVFWKYRLTGRSFRWGNYHPILDAAWTIIDFTHSFCFEDFMRNMMFGHVYTLSMEELFPKKIQACWRLETEVKNDKIWNNVLQTNDLNVTMRNLDACAMAARMASPFVVPLPRPFLSIEEVTRTAPNTTTVAPQKGWNKTIEQYWVHYEKRGGFKKLSNDFGKCYQEPSLEEQEEFIEGLKKGCPAS